MHTANTFYAGRGIVSAPHALAAQSGAQILREGGNALEAGVTVAAVLAVVYPHMSGIGGDSFWLVQEPGKPPFVIDAAGLSATLAIPEFYRKRQHPCMPARGPAAAATVAGTVSGWQTAYHHSRYQWNGNLPLHHLLADAEYYAEHGFVLNRSQADAIRADLASLRDQPGFAKFFLPEERPPAAGSRFRQPRLGATLRYLSEAGLWDFYRGDMARSIADDLEDLGSPLRFADFTAHKAEIARPLTLHLRQATVYNTPAPTQGIAALLIQGLFDHWRPAVGQCDSAAYIHILVEACKHAFVLRDAMLGTAGESHEDLQRCLEKKALHRLAAEIDPQNAAQWNPAGDSGGDTTWFGVVDSAGRMVSAIQSLYHPFGSGVVLPGTGICWHNRAAAFRLEANHTRTLQARRKPFHTSCPGLATLADGRVMAYGSMGGNGQPQTLAALFSRYVDYGIELQAAVDAPRWVLGSNWGPPSTSVKLEARFDEAVYAGLERLGHAVDVVDEYTKIMGHAGAVVKRPDGVLEGAADPRSDGGVAGY